MRHGTHGSQRIIRSGAVLLASAVVLTACGDSSHPLGGKPYDAADQVAVSAGGKATAVTAAGGKTRRTIDADKPLEVSATGDEGRITDVVVVDDEGRHVRGELSADGTRWRNTTPLAAGATYTVKVGTENEDGHPGRTTSAFRTREAPEDKRLEVTLGPEAGTYGVGQPITAELSRKVGKAEQRRIVERALRVTSTPEVTGSWHWVDDKKLHYRPKEYWPTNARISVESRLEGIQVRKGLYGGESEPLALRTGDRVEAVADAQSLQMTVKRNGEVVKTFPITTGKAGFRTRNGTKVILARQSFVRMTSTSIGIGPGSSEYYDMPVHWATRLTWSGEYVHAAPWSAGSHGSANVSHGCTGMSTANARWFFNNVRQGDLVTHVNTEGTDMPAFGNGFGDWNLTWEEWRKGSSLHRAVQEAGPDTSGGAGRLRPRV
ncbi:MULTISPECIES: L,D-transpeptidase [unclassified Streptomyces]|uniref:L,D-transpeptidase n=1 Tax=unclassified Streptomyces TaxID=2593676 RepID=UPI0022B6A520|nr:MULTISPECIES: Ig-like domain-containing protein [unclassified Streptomyces]MCZ7413862.1 Ig-like domain-containing protein [Streptomyces sp. WMMC897]MCZ7430858.1 Ig-like domain-containing protein [Streptomyces sp. WMMC1477]